MDGGHEDILTGNRLLLVRQLHVTEELLSCLLEDHTLTDEMKDKINAEKTRTEKAAALLDTLMRRGPNAFDRFVNSLVQTDQDFLAQTLDEDTAQRYISERDETRSQNQQPSNALTQPHGLQGGNQSYGPYPVMLQGPIQQPQPGNFQGAYPIMYMIPGTQYAAFHPIAPGPVFFSPPPPPPQPNEEVQSPNLIDSTDSRDEEQIALDEIFGKDAKAEMEIKVKLVTNLNMTRDDGVYKVNRLPRGRAVIINNHYFLDSSLNNRKGAQFDGVNLKELFGQLSFTVDVHNNLSTKDIRDVLEKESKLPVHNDSDMFVLFLLSHGNQGNIYGIDGGKLSIEDEIADLFSPENCPALLGKPKIFFIQACQGDLRSKIYSTDSDDLDALPVEMLEKVAELKLEDTNGFIPGFHKKSDVVMSYATVKGYKANRFPKLGSCFVRCMVSVFSRKAHSKHLMDMLTDVNKLLSKLKLKLETEEDEKGRELKIKEKDEGICIQIAQKTDTLTKHIFFFPGADARAEKSLP